ncbi:polysaccharide deacetylase family protein [Fodinicola feengrottensis]|uniref:polysaccharide deacetylase family protein n=1 Tax=Fodinicola feengrottensis TaxID=435914 RepID=UPI0013D175DC|nr:polysaccharide deacetylase family protein [Fodinicola feengrottensis]
MRSLSGSPPAGPTSRPRAGVRALRPDRPRHPPSPSPSASPSPTPAAASALKQQKKAIHTLHEYVEFVPGAQPFPSNAIALTIDDGPTPAWTPKVLALLEKLDIKATFCHIGVQDKGHKALAKSVVSEGHHLANHTYSHPLSLPKLNAATIHKEINDAQASIVDATGFTPHLFRSPGGAWSAEVFKQAAANGMAAIDWEIDPKDWSRPGTELIRLRMLKAKPGDIILCHDGGGDRSQTYDALKAVLPVLKSKGYQFVTLPAPPATGDNTTP